MQNEINRLRNGAVPIETLTRLKLSSAEYPIALAYSQGQTGKEIADRTGLPYDTVKWHLKRIFDKLGVRSKVELNRQLFG